MSNYKCELCTKGCGAKDITGVFCIPIKIQTKEEVNEKITKESLEEASRC